jgi:hypothetical protein
MKSLHALIVIAALCLCIPGCGGEDSSSSSSSLSNTPAASADTPLEGKDLSKSSQLVGTWLFVTDGDFVGFEFMKDGKVLATPVMAAMAGLNSGVMMDYAVMDGGRVSLTTPTGQTQVFGVTISGDQLELKGKMMFAGTDSQRFRRLPAGQTLEQAFEEQQKAEAKARQDKYAALQTFLQKPGLVIVCLNPGPDAPASIAMSAQNDPAGQRAWHDDAPPHIDRISASVDLNEGGKNPLVNVTYGQQLQPPPTQQNYGNTTIAFEVTGDAKNPIAKAKITYGGKPFELELKQDENLHKQIVGRFDAEIARIEGLKKPMADLLKDFAVLEGVSGSEYPNQPKSNTVRIILVRNPAGGYTGESVLINANNGQAAPMPNTTAQIVVIDDKPMLMVDCYNRQYQLTHDPATGKLTGGWFYTNNPNGFVADLKIVEAMDEAARQKKFDAERKALASLSPSIPLIGMANHRGTFLPRPGPVALALTVGPDSKVSGTASFPQVLAVVEVQGQIAETLSGPQLDLQFGNLIESGSIHAGNLGNGLRSQRWAYRIADTGTSGGPIAITDGALILTQATDAHKAELKKKLTDALAAGLTLQMVHPDYGGNSVKQVFKFTIDPAGKVTGTTIAGDNGRPFHNQSTVAGDLADWQGLPYLVAQIADLPPAKAGAFHRTYTAQIVACPTETGWHFTAPYWPDTNDRARQYFEMAEARN